jgi:hypothetical protein
MFRQKYDQLPPHEALGMQTPANCWHLRPKSMKPTRRNGGYGMGAELCKINLSLDAQSGIDSQHCDPVAFRV